MQRIFTEHSVRRSTPHSVSCVRTKIHRSIFSVGLTLLVGLAPLSCSDDLTETAPPPQSDASKLYFRIEVNHHAVTLGSMPPYDTLQLRITPYAADGSVLATSEKPVFILSDSGTIRITPDGLLRAAATSGAAEVDASLTINGVTYRDTVNVTIFPSTVLPKVATAMIVRPLDSAKRAFSYSYTLGTEVRDSAGAVVAGIPVRMWVHDSVYFKFERRRSRLMAKPVPGTAWVHASSTVFGREIRDSLAWTTGHVLAGAATLNAFFQGRYAAGEGTMSIGVGGVVTFGSFAKDTLLDVVFDDPGRAMRAPASPDSVGGNIAPFTGGEIKISFFSLPISRARMFSKPGVVKFWSTRHPNYKGIITVVDERACLPNCPPIP